MLPAWTLNVKERTWSDEILKALEIDKDLLPGLRESVEVSGCVTKEIAQELGLAEGRRL